MLPPPKLEPLPSPPQAESSTSESEPPALKPVKAGAETPTDGDTKTPTSLSQDAPNGLLPGPLLTDTDLGVVATSVLAEASAAAATGNRRTNVLFRKSKSASPQKTPKMVETSPASSPLGTKTFLSVVIPRLETLLLPRKRTRSSSADGEEEDEETPIKRLGTGASSGPTRARPLHIVK